MCDGAQWYGCAKNGSHTMDLTCVEQLWVRNPTGLVINTQLPDAQRWYAARSMLS